MPWYRVEDCNRENIERLGGRLHQKVNGRFITILLHNEQLFCIDSCCYHASGPVGEGPVTDIEDIPTIRCMWHNMIFALDTGERVTQEVLLPGENEGRTHNPVSMSFPLRPQGTTGKVTRSGESVQRVHNVRELDYSDKGIERERWPVEIELEDNNNYPFNVASDKVACNPTYAKMCMTIQQRKIDAPPQQAQEAGEVKNSFARTLLHTLQTSSIPNANNNNNNAGGNGDSPARANRSGSNSNASDLELFANRSSHNYSQQQQKQSSPLKSEGDNDEEEDGSMSPPRRNLNDLSGGASPLVEKQLGASASFRQQLEKEGLMGTGNVDMSVGAQGGRQNNSEENGNYGNFYDEAGNPLGGGPPGSSGNSTSRPPGNPRAPTPPPVRK